MKTRVSAERVGELAQEVEDLRAHRHVERADRLVGDHERRRRCERAGDRDALALAAGELVGVARRGSCGQPDGVEQLAHPAAVIAGDVERAQRLAQDLAHAHAGIERAHRVLEDDLGLPSQEAQLALLAAADLLTLEAHLAGLRLVEREQQPRERRLARSRLADDAEAVAAARPRGRRRAAPARSAAPGGATCAASRTSRTSPRASSRTGRAAGAADARTRLRGQRARPGEHGPRVGLAAASRTPRRSHPRSTIAAVVHARARARRSRRSPAGRA